ncbi:MAG: hypothetical protein WDO24_04250 [Pseudomonadota bacterium]
MARQNRVTPFGSIVRPPDGSPARGDWFGNRGCLHDADGRLVRPWRSRAWLICRLAFKGRRRSLLMPGRYTELFFLDEATAFAAGHRPCGECRWHDYQRFRHCWPEFAGQPITALDAVLHAERIGRAGAPPVTLDQLPDGSFVAPAQAPEYRLSGLARRAVPLVPGRLRGTDPLARGRAAAAPDPTRADPDDRARLPGRHPRQRPIGLGRIPRRFAAAFTKK